MVMNKDKGQLMFICFFFKQKTAYEISSRDWSSDVCSSDLWGLAARNLASRWALVAAPAAPYVASVPFLSSGLISTEDVWFGILGASLVAAITYACLFHLPAVRRYFAAGRDA